MYYAAFIKAWAALKHIKQIEPQKRKGHKGMAAFLYL